MHRPAQGFSPTKEVRKIWTAAESSGVFGSFCKIALLTAQRKAKILGMRWSDISDAGEWTIPKAPREKDNGGPVLVLPPMAIEVIRALPQLRSNPYVFAGHGPGALRGVAKCKHRLDNASGVTGWTIHDLRRCARSLMSRAGVLSEHAERVMGHAIGGVGTSL